MPDQGVITNQLTLLTIHRNRAKVQRQQLSHFGPADAPSYKVLEMKHDLESIATIKTWLTNNHVIFAQDDIDNFNLNPYLEERQS